MPAARQISARPPAHGHPKVIAPDDALRAAVAHFGDRNRFDDGRDYQPRGSLGVWRISDPAPRILMEAFKSWCADEEIDVRRVLIAWRDRGWLVAETDRTGRTGRKVRVRGASVWCVQLTPGAWALGGAPTVR